MPSPRQGRAEWRDREPWQGPDYAHQQEAWRGSNVPSSEISSQTVEQSEATTEALREMLQTLAQAASMQVHQMVDLRGAIAAELNRLRLEVERLQGRHAPPARTTRPGWFDAARTELHDLLEGDAINAQDPDASRLSSHAVEHAVRLIGKLSSDIRIPEIGADVQGNVTLDWQVVTDRVFTIAISTNGMIFWAGLFGENRCHGAERFGDNLPLDLERGIRRALAD